MGANVSAARLAGVDTDKAQISAFVMSGACSVLRTMIGVVTITGVTSGLNMMGINPLWKNIVIGLILIAAVCLNSDTKGRDLIIK